MRLPFSLAPLAFAGLSILPAAKLTTVYTNNDFQITGVTVAKSGRLFVNFPRWSDRYLNAVVEVMKDGSVKPIRTSNGIARTQSQPRPASNSYACRLSLRITPVLSL
jgi:hypothetical protein